MKAVNAFKFGSPAFNIASWFKALIKQASCLKLQVIYSDCKISKEHLN